MIEGAPKPARAVHEMEIDGDVTLFHTETQKALVLNQTASDVWRLIDGEHTVDEIVALLCSVYAADTGTVRVGVESVLSQFGEHDVLEAAG